MSVEKLSQLEEESFPQLPVGKQQWSSHSRRSSISSQSSMSICNQTSSATKDPWFQQLVQDAVVRRRMFCQCKKCVKRQTGLLSKKKWNNTTRYPCEQAVSLGAGKFVKIIATKNYGKNGGVLVFVITSVLTAESDKKVTVQGYVHPDCLGGLEAVRKALDQKEVAMTLSSLRRRFQNASEVEEREQPPKRKLAATFVPEGPARPVFRSQYQFKELVLARDALGHSWYQAEVVSTNPLKLKSSEGVRIFDERNVKKHPTSEFVAVQSLGVRTQEHSKAFVKKTLPKGTVLHVVQMSGFQARITSPECGWVQMRSTHELFAVEKNYELKFARPRMFLGGLPMESTTTDIARALQTLNGLVLPSSVQLFASGDSLCAYVHLVNSRDYKRVVGKEIMVKGRRVKCDWCLAYLRNKASRKLRN